MSLSKRIPWITGQGGSSSISTSTMASIFSLNKHKQLSVERTVPENKTQSPHSCHLNGRSLQCAECAMHNMLLLRQCLPMREELYSSSLTLFHDVRHCLV